MIPSRTSAAIVFSAALTLALPRAGAAAENEPPLVELRPNAPGWITVYWEHPGTDVTGFRINRESPAQTWLAETHVGSVTDMGLAADTEYRYRVCAVYADAEECSEWLAARTMPAEQPRAPHPRPPPIVTRHEAYDQPSRIRIWWRKTGAYERVIVRWRHQTSAAARQEDIDTSAAEGAYDLLTPTAGTYVVLLKGCTLNFVGAANCGDWSAPFELSTAPAGAVRVDCIPGTLRAGSPVFAADGRAEYHFDRPPAGFNMEAGFCHSPGATDVLATYRVHSLWNPATQPTAWDRSGANATETFTLRLWPAFDPERAPRQPDLFDPSVTISFLTRAHCDRDPWLNSNAICRRTGDNVPADIRAKWPGLLTEPFPHTRNAIPVAQRGPLLTRYHLVTGQLVGPARSPVSRDAVTRAPSPTIQGEARPVPGRAVETATRTRTRDRQPPN